jgi:hypothetical protein
MSEQELEMHGALIRTSGGDIRGRLRATPEEARQDAQVLLLQHSGEQTLAYVQTYRVRVWPVTGTHIETDNDLD